MSANTNLRHSLANDGIIAREIRQPSNIAESGVIEEVIDAMDAYRFISSNFEVILPWHFFINSDNIFFSD